MAAVSGQGQTFNLPNYHGELYTVSPTETPFLSAIGDLNGARVVTSTLIEWQTIDRRAGTTNNSAVEGATAPNGSERSRTNINNVVEIHQSAVEVSYTKQAARGNFAGANIAPLPTDAFIDEVSLQTMAELESMALDIEQSFLNGTFSNPANNSTARKTQGILGAVATVSANGGTARAVSVDIVNAHLTAMFNAGAKLPQDTTVLMMNANQKTYISKAYAAAPIGMFTQSRTIGGFSLETVVTPLGTFGVMLNRWMPAGQIAVLNLAVCRPAFLQIENKGTLFLEPLAKTGASDKYQLYGEIGLDYGAPTEHGLLKDLNP